jgi:hypothetical protein
MSALARRLPAAEIAEYEARGMHCIDGDDDGAVDEAPGDDWGLRWLQESDGGEDGEASEIRVKCVSDPVWFELTRPLYQYLLAGDRSWSDLEQWCDDTGERLEMVRQLLAALEWRGDALTVGLDVQLRWRAVAYAQRPRGKRAAI